MPKIIDPKFTSELDKKLEDIEKGKTSYDRVLDEYLKKFKRILEEFKQKEEQIGKEIISKIHDQKLWQRITKK